MKKTFIFASVIGFAAAYWFFHQPISYGTRLKGYITAILKGEGGDILIKFSNDKHYFRIANGLELGIDPKRLKTKLIGKEAIIYYTHPKWPINTTPYITRLICDSELVFTKW
jgi:hypothetical protein